MTKLQEIMRKGYGKAVGDAFYAEVTAPSQIAKLRKVYQNGKHTGALDNAIRRLLNNDAVMAKAGVRFIMSQSCYAMAITQLFNKVSGRRVKTAKWFRDCYDEMLGYDQRIEAGAI
jgi:hypothetical protein